MLCRFSQRRDIFDFRVELSNVYGFYAIFKKFVYHPQELAYLISAYGAAGVQSNKQFRIELVSMPPHAFKSIPSIGFHSCQYHVGRDN